MIFMTEQQSTTPKPRGYRFSILLILAGIILAGIGIWQVYKYKIAKKNIQKAVTEKSKGLYVIHYTDLVIDEVAGDLRVKNVEIIPDTAIFNAMVREQSNPSILLHITVPELHVTGIKTPKALISKELDGEEVEVSDPVIELELNNYLKDKTDYSAAKELYKSILGKLLRINVKTISINHGSLLVKNRGAKVPLFRSTNVSLLFSDLLVDSTSSKDSSRILFCKNVEATGDELILPSKDKRYRSLIKHVQFRSSDNSFKIGLLKLIPQLPEDAFVHSYATQKDRYNFTLENLTFKGIDRAALFKKELYVENVSVERSSFKIYRDLSIPRDTLSRVGKYPQQELLRLSLPVNIRTLVMPVSFIEYKEKNGKSDSAGKVQFYQVHATIRNVTNMKSAIARDNKCTLDFQAKFLNIAPVKARLAMQLNSKRGEFTIAGNIGAISAVALNPLIQPMGLARIKKGTVHDVRFDFKGDDSSSNGKLTILYDDIGIELLRKNNSQNKYDRKLIPTLLAGALVKKSNPGKNGDIRVADVHFDRNLNKSFFNLLWKSIFTGIKETAGMK